MTRTTNKETRAFEKWRLRQAALAESFLDGAMARLEKNAPEAIKDLAGVMRYAVLGGGKRLRPLLALAAAEAVGGRAREALPAAAAVEMVHAYSLIHDDLPAMDDDDLRRGRPTCHRVFGEAAAILAGDALLTLAFETLAAAGARKAGPARANAALILLARAAGAAGMVGGQMLDLALERRTKKKAADGDVTGEMARDMEKRKTGEMIAAALTLGAVLAGAGPAAVARLRRIGLAAGLAFQIRDDLLNLSGDPALLGKAVGSDAVRGKSSFPAVMGVRAAEEELAALTAEALAEASAFKTCGENLTFLIDGLVNRRK
ncbi:MAG: polyprenyl synthetase family protein [Candidatus Adiutrix sp.]|jgi:geranylgeranyl pyrophosphate synthase|nr:polyprenyl synthetase family protein [Candidatus Adiutrix sp.]